MPLDPARELRPTPAFWDEVKQVRRPEHPIDPIFLARWSPRAMTGRALTADELLPLFEAARWAPSSFNSQFWRFVVALRGDDVWQAFLSLLVESNRAWAHRAALLGVILGRDTHPKTGKRARTWAFDCGAAWENLALEGARRGLVVHGMEGFDWERAAGLVAAPPGFHVLAMFAVGERASPDVLDERSRERERPGGREPLEAIVNRGRVGRPFWGRDGDG